MATRISFLSGPPYEQGAHDGNVYFKVLPPSDALINGYRLCLDARNVFLRIAAFSADPTAKLDAEARAAACDLVVKTVSDGAKRVAAITATMSEQSIQSRIDSTQLRPDAPGKPFSQRLRDAISSRPIPSAIGTLEVGIADVSQLDAVVGEDGNPYWRTQEFGSQHLVGKRIRGLFQPGSSPPDQSQFRTHPIFEVGAEGGRSMLIRRPIPEKAFLREGVAIAEKFRAQQFRSVEAAGVSELRLIQTGNHPRLRAVRRVIR